MSLLIFVSVFISTFFSIPNFYYEHPTVDPSTLNICFIGDTGTGGTTQYKMAEQLVQEKCSQVRITGDIIYPSGITHSEDLRLRPRFFDPFASIFNAGIKIYLVMGNHDYRASIDSWITVAQQKPNVIFPNPYYAEVWGTPGKALCFVALDTTPFSTVLQESARVQQIHWANDLQTYWKENKTCAMTITWGHHPYTSSGSHGSPNQDTLDFLDKFAIGHSNLYIAGHDHHLSDEGVIKGTTQLISGAGAQLRKVKKLPAAKFGLSKNGFVIVKVNKEMDKLEYTFKGNNPDFSILWEQTIHVQQQASSTTNSH